MRISREDLERLIEEAYSEGRRDGDASANDVDGEGEDRFGPSLNGLAAELSIRLDVDDEQDAQAFVMLEEADDGQGPAAFRAEADALAFAGGDDSRVHRLVVCDGELAKRMVADMLDPDESVDAPGAQREPLALVVTLLLDTIGSRLTDYIASVRTIAALWSEPDAQAKADRLRAAGQVVRILGPSLSPEGIRSWLLGMNPDCDDEAPIEVLREHDTAVAVAAAESFRAMTT